MSLPVFVCFSALVPAHSSLVHLCFSFVPVVLHSGVVLLILEFGHQISVKLGRTLDSSGSDL